MVLVVCIGLLYWCLQPSTAVQNQGIEHAENSREDVQQLSPLQLTQQNASIALPFCETKNCINVHIQTIQTQDQWLDRWLNKRQAEVVQEQIGLKQNLNLQQAIDAYVKYSDAWQAEAQTHQPFELDLYTRIAAQRAAYVLLQIGMNAQQKDSIIKEQDYFFVADRLTEKTVKLLDIINPKQRQNMHIFVQEAYQKWLVTQASEVQEKAPKQLYWGQADWFFDQEGIGLHFRQNSIVDDGTKLDIYLTKVQTQQMLQPSVYQSIFGVQ